MLHAGTLPALPYPMSRANLRHTPVAPLFRQRRLTAVFGLMLLLLHLPAQTSADSLRLPVEGGTVTSLVGWRLDPFGSGRRLFHRGIDIAVPAGTPVKAVRDGRVVLAGEHGGYGIAVILEHGDASRTLYGHNALTNVRPGELVAAGTVIALSGNSGRSTGPHLHFEELPAAQDNNTPQAEPLIVASRHDLSLNQRAAHEQTIDSALRSVLNRIGTPAYQPALNGQGG